jgi:N-glycosylase/DNA lyase
MVGLSTTAPGFSVNITTGFVNGPLNLTETILSGQTGEPEWFTEGGVFNDVEVLDGTPIKYALSQAGDTDNFSLQVRAVTGAQIPHTDEIATTLKNHLVRVLGLEDDLNFFYSKFADEDKVLSLTFRNLRGLRLMRGTNLFEALICSILSQNNSVRLWNRSARLMMKHYGREVSFLDGSHEFLFPQPETLAKLNPRELRSKTSMGYRAKPIVMVSRMIVNHEFDLSKLANEPYDDAKQVLLELPGVGPKVADCFLLYGAGRLEAAPVDVWIHRIVSKLYFRGRKASRMKTATFLRERFREWAGYAQLYLFDYARREKF